MPRSKRRKGVKRTTPVKGKKFFDGAPLKRYYDPGRNPRPRNMVKAATPRHDHRRGG
jgi:hypothetical protein